MMNRRKFVKTSTGWALACETLISIGGAGCGAGKDDGGGADAAPAPINGILTLPLSDFPELQEVGGDKRLIVEGVGPIIVAQVSSGAFACVRSTCPHEGGSLFWDSGGVEFQCELHGSTFAQNGDLTGGPASSGVTDYPATSDGSNVVIDLN